MNNLKELSAIPSVGGFEKATTQYLYDAFKGNCDEVIFDNLGSIYALKKSKKENAPRVMISANMDEAGLIVNEISKNGLLSFLPLGPLTLQSLINQRVHVVTDENTLEGVIISTVETPSEIKELKVDLGVSSSEELAQLGVRLGDQVAFASNFIEQNDLVISKGLSSTVGCSIAIDVLEQLKDEEFDFDLYVGATVQSEVGMRGGTTATGKILPDFGIVLGCGDLDETLGKPTRTAKMGEGVLLRFYDKGMMPNRGALEDYEELCKKEGIPYQTFYTMSDNDGAWIHKLYQGCPVLNLGIGARNIYTSNAMISKKDYANAVASCVAMINNLSRDKITGFKESNR